MKRNLIIVIVETICLSTKINWKNSKIMSLKLLGLLIMSIIILGLAGCGKKENRKQIDGITSRMSEGSIISDEIYFTNSSGKDLTDVNVVITLTGIKGNKAKTKRYWPTWRLSEKKEVSFSMSDSVFKIQKFDMVGSCNEGSFNMSWIPSNRHQD